MNPFRQLSLGACFVLFMAASLTAQTNTAALTNYLNLTDERVCNNRFAVPEVVANLVEKTQMVEQQPTSAPVHALQGTLQAAYHTIGFTLPRHQTLRLDKDLWVVSESDVTLDGDIIGALPKGNNDAANVVIKARGTIRINGTIRLSDGGSWATAKPTDWAMGGSHKMATFLLATPAVGTMVRLDGGNGGTLVLIAPQIVFNNTAQVGNGGTGVQGGDGGNGGHIALFSHYLVAMPAATTLTAGNGGDGGNGAQLYREGGKGGNGGTAAVLLTGTDGAHGANGTNGTATAAPTGGSNGGGGGDETALNAVGGNGGNGGNGGATFANSGQNGANGGEPGLGGNGIGSTGTATANGGNGTGGNGGNGGSGSSGATEPTSSDNRPRGGNSSNGGNGGIGVGGNGAAGTGCIQGTNGGNGTGGSGGNGGGGGNGGDCPNCIFGGSGSIGGNAGYGGNGTGGNGGNSAGCTALAGGTNGVGTGGMEGAYGTGGGGGIGIVGRGGTGDNGEIGNPGASSDGTAGTAGASCSTSCNPTTCACTVLSVEWLQLSVGKSGKSVAVQWTTASETQNKGFQVERSTDGGLWKALGFVGSTGTTGASYAFTDDQPTRGVSFYRVVQQDLAGTSSTSKVVSYRSDANDTPFWVYPNPAKSQLTVVVATEGATNVQLLDVVGRTVLSHRLSQKEQTLPLQGISAGVYQVVLTQNGQRWTQKLVVE
jgi:Secretion system C-terminal sorting domain